MSNDHDESKPITSNELGYILEVNKKSVSIYNEVAKQNEDVLQSLDDIKEKTDATEQLAQENKTSLANISPKIDSIDKNLLRLVVIFSTIGVGTIINILIQFFHK